MFENLNRILGENTIPNNLKDVFKNLSSNEHSSDTENVEAKPETNSNSSISPEMIQNLLSMLNSNNSKSNTQTSSNSSNIDIDTIMKMKTIMDKMNSNKEDPRSTLLLSLKPYLKPSRKSKIEQYIKLFNMTKVMDVFKPSGGDDT